MTKTTEVKCEFNDVPVILEDYPAYQYLGFLNNGACEKCKIKHVKSAKKHAVTHINHEVLMCAEIYEKNPEKHLENLIRDSKSFDDFREPSQGSITESVLSKNYHKPPEYLP